MGFVPRCMCCQRFGSDPQVVGGEIICQLCRAQRSKFPEPLADARVRPDFARTNFASGSAQVQPSGFLISSQAPPSRPAQWQIPSAPSAPSFPIREQSSEDCFILDSVYPMDETSTTEFKACRPQNFDQSWAINMLAKYICAFLNTEGGTLYYGIRDDHVVRGLKLDARQRDLLRLGIDNCCNRFRPEVAASLISTEFHEVLSPKTHLQVPDLYVVLVKVKKGNPRVVYFTPYPDLQAWVKREASVRELKAQTLVTFICTKMQLQTDAVQVEAPRQLLQTDAVQVEAPRQPLQRTLSWQYWDHSVGWVEYPVDVQQQLESRKKLDEVIVLTFRGYNTSFLMGWLLEVKGNSQTQRIDAKRLDLRPSASPQWVSSLNGELYTFDEESVQALERALEAGRSEVEVAMKDFTVLADLDRMRVTGDLPLLRFAE